MIVRSAGSSQLLITQPDHAVLSARIMRELWPRGVERLAATPYSAALVAHHAVHVYRHKRGEAEWAAFFTEMEGLRDRYLHAATLAMDDLLHDYIFVRLGDLASLTFCNGWSEQQVDDVGYAIRCDGARLTIAPDPFEGREIAIEVSARELPNRPFRSSSEAQTACAAAPAVAVKGIATGT